ncbi:MAG TPA: M10 family metallopeptidase C-terminal domain-containing protein [Allosphingosinicella sp.]|jgi:Ca2+-binding RTX toxin-like protein
MPKAEWTLEQIEAQLTRDRIAWTSTTINYSFFEKLAPHHGNPPNFSAFTPAQRQALRLMFDQVSDVVPLTFVEVPDNGLKPGGGNERIAFFNVNGSNVPYWGSANFNPTEPQGDQLGVINGVEIIVNRYRADVQGNWNPGDSNPRKLLHEALHAIGLPHPGEYNGDSALSYENFAEYMQDSHQYTVMSYWDASNTGANHKSAIGTRYAATPLLHDIAALQKLYGPNLAARTGDTVYGFNSNAGRPGFDFAQNPLVIVSIWDAGGTDTLDLSGFAAPSRIDLEPGAFSDANGMTRNISIAYGATIENAVGGAGNDVLAGNASANKLTGGAGHDLVDGRGGNDVLDLSHGGGDGASGGEGSDVLFFGGSLDGNDRAHGGEGADTIVLQGNYAALFLHSEIMTGIEGLSLQSGTITRWGQSGANSYDYALTASEATAAPGQQFRINAQSLQAGEDLLFNGSAETDGGRYLVYGGFGADQLSGGEGNDVFFFEAGRLGSGDRIAGGGGNDAVVLSGAAAGAATLAATIASGTLGAVESLSFNGRFASDPSSRPSYDVLIHDGNIAPGARLIVNGSSLEGTQQLNVDGSLVTDGRLWLFGGAYGERLTAGAGDDLIYGAGGSDALRGGGGADLFQYRSAGDSLVGTQDRIYDFQHDLDRVDLSQMDMFTVYIGGELSGAAGEVRAGYDADAGLWRVLGDVNGDGGADFLIEVVVEAGQPLTATDFIL